MYHVFVDDYGYGLTGVKAQLQRTQNHTDDDTWIFPSTNYTKVFPIPGSQDTVAIVFVDTTTLAPSENSCCNSKSYDLMTSLTFLSTLSFFLYFHSGVSSSTQKMLIDDQLYHIEKALLSLTTSANPPKWLLMAGHYPVFSGGEHGDTDELVQYLQPLIEEYNVDAYICGHDHISEHLQYGSTHYFVAGAGSMADKLGNTNSQANMVWYGVGYSAFAVGEATSTSLTVSFVDTSNAVKYSYSLTKMTVPPSLTPVSMPPSLRPTANSSEFPTWVPFHSPVSESLQYPDDPTPDQGIFGRTWEKVRLETARRPILVASGGAIMIGLTIMLCAFANYRRAKKKTKAILYPSKSDSVVYFQTDPTTSGTPKVVTPSHDGKKAMSTEIYHTRSLSSGDHPGTWSFLGNVHSLVPKDISHFEGEDDNDNDEDEDTEGGLSKARGSFMHQLAVQKLQLSVDTKNFRNVRYHRGSLAAIHTTFRHDLLSSLPQPESVQGGAADGSKHHLRRATVAPILTRNVSSKSLNIDHSTANPLNLSNSDVDGGKVYAEIVDIYGTSDNNEIDFEDSVLRV